MKTKKYKIHNPTDQVIEDKRMGVYLGAGETKVFWPNEGEWLRDTYGKKEDTSENPIFGADGFLEVEEVMIDVDAKEPKAKKTKKIKK